MLSQHPADRLIRELLATRRPATPEEVALIIARMASAPFDPRAVAVLTEHQHFAYDGVELGSRASSIIYHLMRRIVVDNQWAPDTTTERYLSDLRTAILAPTARLALYSRRGGAIAAAIIATALVVPNDHLGQEALSQLLVIYSADRASLITGYQCSSLATTGIPAEALWLK